MKEALLRSWSVELSQKLGNRRIATTERLVSTIRPPFEIGYTAVVEQIMYNTSVL
jgi:hypothetical protein